MKKLTLTFVSLAFFSFLFLGNNTLLAQDDPGWINWYEDSDLTDPDGGLEPAFLATPNPNTGNNLKVYYTKLQGEAQISLFDMAGHLQKEKTVGSHHEASGVATFSIATLSAGIYFVKLTNGLFESVQKIIIR